MGHLLRKTILGILLVLLLAGMGWFNLRVVEAQEYQVRAEHPRMWITTDTLAELRARKDLPGVKEHYDRIISYINEANPTTIYSHARVAQMSAFLYLATGNTIYADKSIASFGILAPQIKAWGDTHDYKNGAVFAWRVGFAYDWVYDQLSESQKNSFGQMLVKLANIALNAYRHSDYNNHYFNRILPPIVFAGIALYNNGYQNAEAISFLDYAEDNIKNHSLKVIETVSIRSLLVQGR